MCVCVCLHRQAVWSSPCAIVQWEWWRPNNPAWKEMHICCLDARNPLSPPYHKYCKKDEGSVPFNLISLSLSLSLYLSLFPSVLEERERDRERQRHRESRESKGKTSAFTPHWTTPLLVVGLSKLTLAQPRLPKHPCQWGNTNQQLKMNLDVLGGAGQTLAWQHSWTWGKSNNNENGKDAHKDTHTHTHTHMHWYSQINKKAKGWQTCKFYLYSFFL